MSESVEGGMPQVASDIPVVEPDKAMEVLPPIMFFGDADEYDLLDLRPVPVEAQRELEEVSPKDSSAQESVSILDFQQEVLEETVPVEKDSGQPKESESGQQTSSSKTPAGKAKQTASQ